MLVREGVSKWGGMRVREGGYGEAKCLVTSRTTSRRDRTIYRRPQKSPDD